MNTLTPKTTPRAHQVIAHRLSDHKTGFAYLMEMGTGKSKCIIDDYSRARVRGEIDHVFIVAGKGSYADWANEHIPIHMSDDLPRSVHLWRGGNSRAENDRIERFLSLPPQYIRILIMNAEAISMSSKARSLAEKFCKSGRTFVTFDESSMLRNHESRISEWFMDLAHLKSVVYRRIASGTPSPKNPMDLWAQYEFIKPGSLGYRSFYAYRARYAIMEQMKVSGRTIHKIVAFKNIDELSDKDVSYRVLKSDCLDLPPKVYEIREVEMTDQQRSMYNEMKKLSSVEHEELGLMTTTTVMGRMQRLHQILLGTFTSDLDGSRKDIDSNRVNAILDIAADSEESTIIFCQYQRDVENVSAALQKEYGSESVVTYYGPTKQSDRAEAILRFQSKSARFFVATLATACRGITLTAATMVIYYSNSYDLEHRLQSEDRAHRDGQKNTVVYVDLMVRGTVDEKIVGALRKKIDIATAIMSDGPKAWLI